MSLHEVCTEGNTAGGYARGGGGVARLGERLEISVFDNDVHESTIRRALASEGHDITLVAREDELGSCDLVVLDAAAWPEAAVDRLVTRLPHAEFLLLVDDARPR